MSDKTTTTVIRNNPFSGLLYTIFAVCTAMIGYEIHHNAFYSVCNFFFAPIAWIYWLITHHVTLAIIKSAFSFFFN